MYHSDAIHPRPSLAQKLKHLYSLKGGPTIDLTIRPAYYELLRRLGNPHQKLPPVIHVAGTNGKGSTIAFMRALLEATGKAVHSYTSPHLITFNERINLKGNPIGDDSLEALLDEVLKANDGLALTFFEITTALAFVAFSRTPADYLLLETGLGGRLDCTNVIETPLVSVITPISYDHREFLGDTLSAIAAEKAGIIKRGSCCVMAPQPDRVSEIVKNKTTAESCDFYGYGETWRIAVNGAQLIFSWRGKETYLNRPPLTGMHQIYNLGTALAALAARDEAILSDPARLNKGLAGVSWPARLQKLAPRWMGGDLPEGWELWLDGGHNGGAGTALADQARQWQNADKKTGSLLPLYLFIGMMRTKDPAEFLQPLAPYARSILALPIAGEPLAWKPEDMAAYLQEHGMGCKTISVADKAFSAIKDEPPGRILVAGSLYLAGRLLAAQQQLKD